MSSDVDEVEQLRNHKVALEKRQNTERLAFKFAKAVVSSSSIEGAGANDSLKIPALHGQQVQWRQRRRSILKPIYDGDKRMAAEIVERAKARQIYNEIVRRQIDPGLIEYAGKGSKQTIESQTCLL